MKKLIYASSSYEFENDLFNKFKRLTTSKIIVTSGVGLPRNIETDFHPSMHPIPASADHNITFDEATIKRLGDLMALAATNDLPIVVMWSGGIDSTVILAAMVRFFSRELMQRVIVQMSNASYFENPYFFKNVIKKYNIAYTNANVYNYNNAIIVHGDPADAIWIHGLILSLHKHNDVLRKNNSVVKTFLRDKTDADYADWLYDFVINNATSSNINIETTSDFMWWLNFNFNYSTMCLRHIGESLQSITPKSAHAYSNNFFAWYTSDDYQNWSIQTQNTDIKYDGTIRSFKMPAKEFIFDIDKNSYYRDYKTKVHSPYLTERNASRVYAMFEDGTTIIK